MPNGEGKNWIRLCGAIDGFRSSYKSWPTRIRLGATNLNDIKGVLKPDDYIKLQNKLDIVVDNVQIIAEDDSGRNYDYEKEGFTYTKPDVKAQNWLGLIPDSEMIENVVLLGKVRMKELMARFESSFREWVESACKEWKYPKPATEFYSEFEERIPDGLRATLGFGLNNGIILSNGHTFSLKELPSSKGPYNWFSRNSESKIIRPNWEYYVQVAEYVRLHEALAEKGYSLTFEDSLMDIGVYDGDKLIVFCEIKVESNKAIALVEGIKQLEQHVDLNAKDRGNDPLRKAKYIIEHKPEYFCVVAIGVRHEYRLSYPDDKEFELIEDMIPFV